MHCKGCARLYNAEPEALWCCTEWGVWLSVGCTVLSGVEFGEVNGSTWKMLMLYFPHFVVVVVVVVERSFVIFAEPQDKFYKIAGSVRGCHTCYIWCPGLGSPYRHES